MDKSVGQKNAGRYLHPMIEPFERRMLPVGEGHEVYVEQSGNPNGQPVVVFHGGPGGGSNPIMRRFFDPQKYRIILFDQRGCGRSVPFASLEHNTTWHLVRDIEQIRKTLGIDRWILFGGSWGATLALVYAQTHPQRVVHMVLRGVFLGTKAELDWFYGGGAAAFWPDLWQKFIAPIPKEQRSDLIAAYRAGLTCDNQRTQIDYAQAWCAWETALASLHSNDHTALLSPEYARAFARLENHYFAHLAFLTPDQQILHNMDKLEGIPSHIVQGRYDMICPPTSAYRLAQAWRVAQLRLIAQAGHALSETGIAQELVSIMDKEILHGRLGDG